CGIVRLGSVACSSWQSFLQERPYATAYWPFSVRESCTSNANPPYSEHYLDTEINKLELNKLLNTLILLESYKRNYNFTH
ncbi:hypothetical protein, partial [Neisseria meningitidis]|uniref:hypothetical protein n=1 Tax=Neisseria meningitidis TaxID=487 RepID=UPI001C82B02F